MRFTMIRLSHINYMITKNKYYMNKKNMKIKYLVSYIVPLEFYHIQKEL